MKTLKNISVFEAQNFMHLCPGKIEYTSAYSFTITNNGAVIAIFDENKNTLKVEKNLYNANK